MDERPEPNIWAACNIFDVLNRCISDISEAATEQTQIRSEDKMEEKDEMKIMKGHILAMFNGEAPFEPPVTFPQSHIIYAGSIHEAHKIIKEGGYFVVNGEDVQFFKASATPDINFKIATDSLTPAFSELGFKGEKGCKTFFAKDYRKLRISLGEDGRTTDWILMKQAKRCNDMTATGDVTGTKKALAGTVMTSKLPRENNNYEEENPAEGWRKERRKVRKALKNSPAYIRGRLATPPKKKEPKGSGAKELEVQTKVEKVMQKKKEEQVTMKEGRAKCSRYFAFVKKILEVKKIKRAGQREESSEQGGVNVEAGQDPLTQVNISSLDRHHRHYYHLH